jgi:acyl-coenzyme A synthetase/AMP-(fatty) acid ligase
MKRLPLIRHFESGAPLLLRPDGTAISQAAFVAQAMALAERWPAAAEVINLCENRHHFLLGLVAASLAGAVSLLPPSRGAEHLALIRRAYPNALTVAELTPPDVAPWHGQPPELPQDHPLIKAYTSGSTGVPKANNKSWGSLARTIRGSSRALGLPGERVHLLATVPTQHMYGLETVGLMPLLGYAAGATARPFYPNDISEALRALPTPRLLITTPIHLRALADTQIAMPALAGVISATAPLDADLAARAEAALDTPVREIYGCSETASIAARRPARESLWHLYEGVQIQFSGEEATVHTPALKQPFLLPDRMQAAGENAFRLLGRGGDLINVAGKRASLAELTRVLRSLPGVEDGVVFLPSDDAKRPAALVVAPQLSEADLRGGLLSRIDAAFLPRPLQRVPRLPRNELGKLPRAQLLASLEAGS